MKIKTTTIRTIREEDLYDYINTLNSNLKSSNQLDVYALALYRKIEYKDKTEHTSGITTIEILPENKEPDCKWD